MRRAALIAAVAAGLAALACGGASPTAMDQAAPVAVTTSGQADESGGVTSLAGMKTETATGTLDYESEGTPGRGVFTPSGMCHLWDYPVYDYFYGDIAGPVTFLEQGHGPCDFSHLSSRLPPTW